MFEIKSLEIFIRKIGKLKFEKYYVKAESKVLSIK